MALGPPRRQPSKSPRSGAATWKRQKPERAANPAGPGHDGEGLDGTFGAVFMVAYQGAIGAEHAILSHTYNPLAVWEARLNGVAGGDSALNALVALH